MTSLKGITNLTINASRQPTDVLVGLEPGDYQIQVAVADPNGLGDYIAAELLSAGIDKPVRFYFAVSDEHGVSNEISKTLTLRMERVAPPVEPPTPPIILAGIQIDLDVVNEDDTDEIYTVETSE